MALPQDLEDPKFEVVKIGRSNYRKLVINESIRFKCGEQRYYDDDEEQVANDAEIDRLMEYEGDEWVLRLPIPSMFHKFIVGSRAREKQRLEMQSGARIEVPHREHMEDSITVRARHKQQIYSVKAQIELLCEKAESKLEYTHFLSIPLAQDATLRRKVDEFREDVVLQRFPGIDASIFMPANRLHFTVCMLKLHSFQQIDEMKQALGEAAERISRTAEFHRALTVDLQGLHIMNDDPRNVGVVFTTDRSSALQHRINSMAELVFAVLKGKGLLSEANLNAQRLLSSDGQHAEVKLHATLMNTKYSKSGWRDGPEGARAERETFDASGMMERFAGIDFGTVAMNEIQLSCLDEMGDNGYYRSLTSIPICAAAG